MIASVNGEPSAAVGALVVFGTTEGHTARIAATIADALRARGVAVDLVDLRGHQGPIPDPYEGVVVAASVHAGAYQRSVRRWVRTHAHSLNAKPTAFVSVSLAVQQRDPEVRREVTETVERFRASTGWYPEEVVPFAGALLYRQYNWLKRWMMRRIVAKAGGDTDTSRDYEYTDWAAVRAFSEQFAARLAARAAS